MIGLHDDGSVHIVVLMEPVSVNHYVKHTRSGRPYKTQEAQSFEKIGAIACRGVSVAANAYSVTIAIWQGRNKKGDLDNYAKQTLDLLSKNGVLLDKKGRRSTDAHVVELCMSKHRDRACPRTEIWISGVESK